MNLFAWYWSFCVVAGVLYTALIVWFLNGWRSIGVFHRQQKTYHTKVTVLVPFYNEAKNLEQCVRGLLNQAIQTTDYEILLIDDQSTDQSKEIAKDFAAKYQRVSYLFNENKGKKRALMLGVQQALGQLIVTTDADCRHPEFWLASMVEYYEIFKPNLIVGPVVLETGLSFFQQFQQMEFVSLVASGAGAIGINHAIMCNGANLAFDKEIFNQFDDPLNIEYQSGDDVFLLHQMKIRDSDKIHFLKSEEAIVSTSSQESWHQFMKQRRRWLSKAPGYDDGDTKFTAFVVFTASFLWVIGLVGLSFNTEFWKPVLFMFILKTLVDFIFLRQVSEFFNLKKILPILPVFQVFYGFYVLVSVLSIPGSRK